MSDYAAMTYSQFTSLQKKARIIPLSDFAKFTQKHKGCEFYNRKNGKTVYLWEIHETFTDNEIKMIIDERNGLIGYREKVKEEE